MRRAGPEALGLLFTEAHTVKRFSSAPVGDEQLAEIWDLAKWPPTMFNVQPLRVLFVRTPEGFDRLLPHLTERNRAQSASAPVTAVLALDRGYHRHADRVVPHMPQLRDYLEAEEAERLELGRFSAALQAGYLILAIRAAGLHAGPMSGFDRAGLDGEFFPDGRLTTLLVVNIGHPDGAGAWRERQARLPHDDVLRWA